MINGNINSSKLLNYFNFYVPQCKTRSTNTFYTLSHRTNYLINAPINRIMRLAYDTQVDLFNFNSIESFYNYIINYYM